MSFLREECKVKNEDVCVKIHCYLNNGISFEDVERFWLSLLGLQKSNMRKSYINTVPCSSKQKRKGKHPYGICHVVVHDVELIQKIYGAIQEYTGVDKPEWLG